MMFRYIFTPDTDFIALGHSNSSWNVVGPQSNFPFGNLLISRAVVDDKLDACRFRQTAPRSCEGVWGKRVRKDTGDVASLLRAGRIAACIRRVETVLPNRSLGGDFLRLPGRCDGTFWADVRSIYEESTLQRIAEKYRSLGILDRSWDSRPRNGARRRSMV